MWPFPRQKGRARMAAKQLVARRHQLEGNPLIPNPVQIKRYEHHLTHAVYGCYSSPFDEAVCAVVDGMGEVAAIPSSSTGRNRRADPRRPVLHEAHKPGSVLRGSSAISAASEWLKGEEWKVMGLAPYGRVDEELYKQLKSM